MIVVLPPYAHEQHWPHLPFETDTIIAEGEACRVSDALPADLNVNFPARPAGRLFHRAIRTRKEPRASPMPRL